MSLPSARKLHLFTGLKYQVLEWGADDSTLDHTVVLVHGFLDSSFSFEALAHAGLDRKYHLVAPDLRGHGDSDRVGAGGYYHFMDYVADLSCVIDQLGRRRVSLVGHSMGGTVAAYFAGVFPDRIYKLALLEGLGPPDNDWKDWPPRIAAWISAWKRRKPSNSAARGGNKRYATLQQAAERLSATDEKLTLKEALRLAEVSTLRLADGQYVFKHDPLHLTPSPYLFMVAGAESLWRRIKCPTLIVNGADSEFRLAHEELNRRVACFAAASQVVLPGAGHMMQRHKPRELAQLLDEFLSDDRTEDLHKRQ